VTHELRTPLAVVRAYTELLADDPPLEGRESRDVERRERRAGWYRSTMEQVARLDRLVDSILASVRVGSEPSADLTPVDVGQVIAETAAEMGPLVARHRLELREGIRLFALTDPSRLRQILEHLVENAVKYAPPETAITLDWKMADGSVRIGVSDEGPGIPEEWRERIFEPYARRETHTARGSGIGLYAARKLAASVGARLWCEPAKGHGARFVIALPAAAAV
jgi:signal transduction histidine kinase